MIKQSSMASIEVVIGQIAYGIAIPVILPTERTDAAYWIPGRSCQIYIGNLPEVLVSVFGTKVIVQLLKLAPGLDHPGISLCP